MKQCTDCGEYTLTDCDCEGGTEDVGPGKFSPDDEYVSYRVKHKQEEGEL